MRILHIALKGVTFPNNGLTKSFKNLGHEVVELDWQSLLFNVGVVGMWDRVFQLCEQFRPEIIFCQIQREGILDEREAVELSKYGNVINYTFDISTNMQWYIDVANHISLTCVACKEDVNKLIQKGVKKEKVVYVQSSFDSTIYQKNREESLCNILFIGHNYESSSHNFPLSKQRREMVDFMYKEFPDYFQVLGMGWGDKSRMVLPKEEVAYYNRAAIVITQNQFTRQGYTSDRLFRATACGAFTISQWYPFMQNDFPEIESWNSFDGLKRLCKYYLEHENARNELAQKTYERTITIHTWENRINQIISLLN